MQSGYKAAPELPINSHSRFAPYGLIMQLNNAKIAIAVQQIKEHAFAVQLKLSLCAAENIFFYVRDIFVMMYVLCH